MNLDIAHEWHVRQVIMKVVIWSSIRDGFSDSYTTHHWLPLAAKYFKVTGTCHCPFCNGKKVSLNLSGLVWLCSPSFHLGMTFCSPQNALIASHVECWVICLLSTWCVLSNLAFQLFPGRQCTALESIVFHMPYGEQWACSS